MACLETTFLIDLLRGEPKIKELKDELDKTEISLSVAAPSVMEIWTGAAMSRFSSKEKERIKELMSSLSVLPLNEKSAMEAGEIEAGLLKTGTIIETEDIMIAAIARSNGEKVVTRDQHYAKIPGLTIIKY